MTHYETFIEMLKAVAIEYTVEELSDEAEGGHMVETKPNTIGCSLFAVFDATGNIVALEPDITDEVDAMIALTKRAVVTSRGVALDEYERTRFDSLDLSDPEEDDEDEPRGTAH